MRVFCRRQPLMPCRRNNLASASSVSLFPRPRIRDITSDRFALVKTSGICFYRRLRRWTRMPTERDWVQSTSRSTSDSPSRSGIIKRFRCIFTCCGRSCRQSRATVLRLLPPHELHEFRHAQPARQLRASSLSASTGERVGVRCRIRFRQHLPPAVFARGLHAQHDQQRGVERRNPVATLCERRRLPPAWAGGHRPPLQPGENEIGFVAGLRPRLRREAQSEPREQFGQMTLAFQFNHG